MNRSQEREMAKIRRQYSSHIPVPYGCLTIVGLAFAVTIFAAFSFAIGPATMKQPECRHGRGLSHLSCSSIKTELELLIIDNFLQKSGRCEKLLLLQRRGDVGDVERARER